MQKYLKIIYIIFLLFIIIATSLFIYKVKFETIILEEKFFFHETKIFNMEKNKMLLIQGKAMHSAYGIDSIKIINKKNELMVLAKMKLMTKSTFFNSVNLALELPKNIERVTFGKKKAILWERNKKTEALEPNNSD